MTHSTFEHPYFGIFMLFIITFTAFILTSYLQRLVSTKFTRKDREKLKVSTYECGVISNKQPNRISTSYYIVALLFILFDIEVIFMFPCAVDFKRLGMFGFVEMLLFVFVLMFGFIYAWKKGALSWQSIK